MIKKVFLISSSHLDREWYFSFEKFRIQICQVIDKVLLLFKQYPEYTCFMLDGQTCVLEDYLEIYPERKDEIKDLIKNDRLIIGPWYIQPDEFLPCGESHIRNLITGYKIASEYGNIMKVGYLPDSFGHISQMPQILRGFGINNAFFMRGLDMKHDREFIWEAPDGSNVFTVLESYGNGATMDFTDMSKGIRIINNTEELKKRIEENVKSNTPIKKAPYGLITYGADHCPPANNIVKMVNEVNRLTDKYEVEIVSLEKFFSSVSDCKPDLATVKGELRRSEDILYLKDTLASRIYIKTENHFTQKLLMDYAEPICTAAWCEGMIYPKGFIEMAWKYLLQNHTHDGICGCSIDDVYSEMMIRFKKCQDISARWSELGFKYIMDRINTDTIEDGNKALVVFNPLGFENDETVEIDITLKEKDCAGQIKLFDDNGNEMHCQIIDKKVRERIETDIEVCQRFYKETIFRVAFNTGAIPPLGYRTYRVVSQNATIPIFNPLETIAEDGVRVRNNTMENKYLLVEINTDGTFNIYDKENNNQYNNIHYFEDSGDAGDVYNYQKPKKDAAFDSRNLKWDISLVYKGPAAVQFTLEAKMLLPESLSADKSTRSSNLVINTIQFDITLHSKSRYVSITTRLGNNSSDHRLRVMFPTHIDSEYSYADGHFIVDKRGMDEFPYLHPQQTFVDINNGKKGIAVFNKGIPQYEVLRDGSNTISLTLLKCQDTLYRSFFSSSNEEFKGAQCKGQYTLEYAVYPHKGDWLQGDVYRKANFFSTGVYSGITGKHSGSLLPEMSFISIEPKEMVLSAVKKKENGNKVIVRLFNIANKPVCCKITFYKKLHSAELLNLNEEFLKKLGIVEDYVLINAREHKILTVALQWAE